MDVFMLTAVGEQDGQETNNVFYFERSNPLGSAQGLIDSFLECFRSAWRPVASDGWKLKSVKVMQVSPTKSDEVVVQAAADDKGTQGAVMAGNNAMLLQLRTSLGGRSNRGRKYLAGVAKSATAGGRLTDAQIALLIALAACMISKFVDTISTSAFALVVFSRKKWIAANRDYGQAVQRVTSITVEPIVASMRSRRIGHGK